MTISLKYVSTPLTAGHGVCNARGCVHVCPITAICTCAMPCLKILVAAVPDFAFISPILWHVMHNARIPPRYPCPCIPSLPAVSSLAPRQTIWFICGRERECDLPRGWAPETGSCVVSTTHECPCPIRRRFQLSAPVVGADHSGGGSTTATGGQKGCRRRPSGHGHRPGSGFVACNAGRGGSDRDGSKGKSLPPSHH